jgi:hypothetical protein
MVLFPTHLAAAALVGFRTRLPVLWLVVGGALPDLVDKPLATLGVFELFHTVAHSGLVFLLFVPAVRYGPEAAAVLVGWGLHLCLDAGHIVINGRPGDALFLVWPLREPTDPLALGPIDFLFHYLLTPSFFLELFIWGPFLVLGLREWRAWRRAGN